MPGARDDPLANQNIKDRFYGQEDPVAEKMLKRQKAWEEEGKGALHPPADPTVVTLMVGGLDETVGEQDLRDVFYSHGEVAGVRFAKTPGVAFVEYTTRGAAEAAAKALHGSLVVKGARCRLSWANRPAGSGAVPPTDAAAAAAAAAAGAEDGTTAAAPAAASAAATYSYGNYALPLPRGPPGPPGAGGGGPPAVPLPPPQLVNFVPAPPPPTWAPPPPMPVRGLLWWCGVDVGI
jgi:pre-mRNA-splicing factor RBM22/SLT11